MLPSPEAGKQEWRTWARRQRESVNWADVSSAVVAGLKSWIVPNNYQTVLVFLPMAGEVDLNGLLEADRETRFVATRTPDGEGDLSVHELGGPLEVHRLGFLQPHETARRVGPDEIDIALLPGLAFDLYGTRLGRGAGYYDRLLARPAPRRPYLLGIAHECQRCVRIPAESWDVPLDGVLTPRGLQEFRARRT